MEYECSTALPPGFRFHPTDEEIITHYLAPKATDQTFHAAAIGEVDLNKCEPWDLPSKAKMGEKEWYFFCRRDRKYPTGMRTNRATESGYWKATGKDNKIFRFCKRNRSNVLVGMKKTLVFYTGRAPRGENSNWVMHEYRLQLDSPFLSNLPKPINDEWVVCRVFHKNNGAAKGSPCVDHSRPSSSGRFYFDNSADPSYFSAMPPLDDFTFPNPNPAVDTSSVQQDYYRTAIRQCKAERFANQSIVSEDAGLSADPNTEISSVVPWHEAETGLDLDNMWKC